MTIKKDLDLSELNVDGTHTIAKKGAKSVAYQARKKAKTSNIIPVTDAEGFIIATTELIAGNHNDLYQLKDNLRMLFKQMKQLNLPIKGAYFNGDKGFDTRQARKSCFNHGLIPNIAENKRNRQRPKRGRKRLFNETVYKKCFVCERTFAWVDKFRALLLRFDYLDESFMASHHIAFSMINLRHVLAN